MPASRKRPRPAIPPAEDAPEPGPLELTAAELEAEEAVRRYEAEQAGTPPVPELTQAELIARATGEPDEVAAAQRMIQERRELAAKAAPGAVLPPEVLPEIVDVLGSGGQESAPHLVGGWKMAQKSGMTAVRRMDGPFEVTTREGVMRCEDGWLALDAGGAPYPIDATVFAQSYVVMSDAPERPDVLDHLGPMVRLLG